MHKCEICQYKTKYKCDLLSHNKTAKHARNVTLQKQIKRVKYLGKTRLIKKKRYKCDNCHKTFLRNYNLKRHMTNSCRGLPPKRVSMNDYTSHNNDEMYDSDSTIESLGSNCSYDVSHSKTQSSHSIKEGIQPTNSDLRVISSLIENDTIRQLLDVMKEYNMIDKFKNTTICPFCDKKYSRKDNRMRHMDKCNKIDIYKAEYKALLAERKNKDMEKEKDIYKDHSDKLSTAMVIKTNGGSLGKIADISNKYPNAKPLQLMDYDDYLQNTNYTYNKKKSYKDYEGQFLEEVICANKDNSSAIILSQAIINMYKKESTPDKQSIWCTDTSRLKYVVMKEDDNDKTTKWESDPGGAYIKKMIIDPLMDSLDDLLENYHNGKYLEEYKEYLREKYPKKKSKHMVDRLYLEQHTRYQLEALKLRDQITKGKLQTKILKYLTDYFTFSDNKNIKDISRKKKT